MALTRLDDLLARSPDNSNAVEMFILKEPLPTDGLAHTVEVDVNAGANYVVGGSVSFSGVNQVTPTRQFTRNSGSDATPTVTVASATNEIVLDTVSTRYEGGILTVGAGQTQQWNGYPSCFANLQSVGAGSTEPGAASTTMSWGIEEAAPWAIGAVSIVPLAPTQVELASFTAKQSDGGVNLAWETGHEVDNLGFNVYREEGGKRVRLNPSLIAGSALIAATPLTSGFSYSWLDARGTTDSVYWLEDVDLDGTRTLHGPITALAAQSASVSAQPRPQQQAPLLTQLSKVANPAASQVVREGQPAALSAASVSAVTTAPATPPLPSYILAARPAVKISVRQTGWYRVTQPELVAAGLPASADVRNLRLYADGVEQNIRVYSMSGRMDADAYLEFYGTGLNIPSTDTRTYWLIASTTPGKRIPTLKGTAAAPTLATKPSLVADASRNHAALAVTLPQSFAYTLERRDRMLYFSALRNGDAENFFGSILASTPVQQVFTIHHLYRAGEQPSLEVVLQGVSFQDHAVKVLVNGFDVGTARYTGQANSSTRLTVSQSFLHEGNNTVKLITQLGETDVSLVDALRLTYQHIYRADGNRQYFTANSLKTVRVDGFTSPDVRLLEITDPNQVQEIIPQVNPHGTGYAIIFDTGASLSKTPRTFLAFTGNQYEHAAEVKANQVSGWSKSILAADLVIITHRDFRAAVEPLARLRRSQGKLVRVIDVEDLYDEFSYGAHSPQAIQDFLAWSQSHWAHPPRFVLLVGDGSYDPRNYQGHGQYDLLPTRMVDTQYMETADDDWFADFNNDGIAELAIGRLPARTASEAQTMVKKIINYSPNNSAGRGVLLISDRVGPDGFSFEEVSDQLKPLIPQTVNVQTIVRGQEDADTMKALIIDGINQGQLIANYAGHGAYERWTGDGILRATDASALANNGKPTLFVTMTCMNGYYHNLTTDSLAEALIKVENGGAVAVWASSGITVPTTQSKINQELYQQLFSSPALTLGEAVQRAKAATSDLDVRRTWILFGDPTMLIR